MTLTIAGIPRGGTTMVAAAVDALGIYLGPRSELREFTFEDQRMNQPYKDVQHEHIKKTNKERKVWGWKDPGGLATYKDLFYSLRNPRVIVVFRDMFASIQSEMRFDEEHEIEPPRSFSYLAEETLNRLRRNLRFINRTQLPTMVVSYERAIVDRARFVDELCEFLYLQPTEEERQLAIDRISTTGGYLQQW